MKVFFQGWLKEYMEKEFAPINWFPGHMAKTRRLLQEQLRRVDLVIELCDARLPFSSRNPELEKMIQGKRRILFLNKSDLADPAVTKNWLKHFRLLGEDAHVISALSLKTKETIGIIDQVTKEIVNKENERGIRKTVRGMVIGVPNVGKSTIINRLKGNAIARTGDRPGVTKSNQWVRISTYLELLDTPGMLWPRLDDQEAAMKLCWIGSVSDEVVDLSRLTMALLSELKIQAPEEVKSRFHLNNLSPEGIELLDAVCRGRGWLLKGNRCDYDRCFSVVLDEFRSGKLGRISLENPGKEERHEGQEGTRAGNAVI